MDMASHKFIVIADDFTGANDCGVQFKEHGLSAVTILDKDNLKRVCGYDVVIIDSETRNMTPEESYGKSAEIGAFIRYLINDGILYKKIDSTLRGNIVSELEALNNSIDPDIIVFAPAYPGNNRTTVHGIQYLNGIPADRTDISKDPKHSAATSDLRKLLDKCAGMDFTHVDICSIRAGEINKILGTAGSKYFSFDAETDEDIDTIVNQVMLQNKLTLWVGSAGLAGSIARKLSGRVVKRKPVLAVIGSVNSISMAQAQKAAEDKRIANIKPDIESILLKPDKEKARIVAEAADYMDRGLDILIASALDSRQVAAASALSKNFRVPLNHISTVIAGFLGDVVQEVLKTGNISGIFITGGDTAINVIQKLSAFGSLIIEEIETGVPYVRLLGGPFEGLKMVTKAGAFGNENTLVNALNYLRNNAQ